MYLTGYRTCLTGVFEYYFFRGDEELCRVSGLVVPSPPVTIETPKYKYVSKFDMGSTVFPGLKRFVKNEDDNRIAWQIVYRSAANFEILYQDRLIRVQVENDGYQFSSDGEKVAEIRYVKENALSVFRNGMDMTQYFDVTIADEVSADYIYPIVSFPLLRFAR